METFEIWMEGYAASGSSSGASYVGKADGETFEDAVRNHYRANPAERTQHGSYFDEKRLTYWGCRHFPTESAARQSFG